MPTTVKKSVNRVKSGLHKAVSIADAKATLSSLVTGVETKRIPVTILRRGVPVAKIVPIEPRKIVSGYGWMRGTITELGDIVGPTGEEWAAGDE